MHSEKACTKCGVVKPLDEFYTDARASDGRGSHCKECCRARRREAWATDRGGHRTKDFERRAARTPEQVEAYIHGQFVYRLKRVFGLTLEQYEAMEKAQDGKCLLCLRPETKVHHRSGKVQRLAVDHDHACCPSYPACGNCTRGLLCSDCNQWIEKAVLVPARMERLVPYLQGELHSYGRVS